MYVYVDEWKVEFVDDSVCGGRMRVVADVVGWLGGLFWWCGRLMIILYRPSRQYT